MNKDLQYLLDFIKNAEHLSEKEKTDLTKSVRNADKELTISEFKLERTEKVKKTTAILLEETIAELEQKRKDVEKHNRELEIETALERVRSKTMAMHNSEDVGGTVANMFDEFVKLGIQTNRCGILIFSNEPDAEVWTAKSNPAGKANLIIGKLDMTVHGLLNGIHKAWKNKEPFYNYTLEGDDLRNYYRALNDLEYYPTKFDMEALPSKEFHSDFYFPEGAVFAFTAAPIAEEISRVIKRFAGVFGQTYRRFLDLQKAETQAREAQISLALERIRARTMSMQHSEELSETAQVLYQQFSELGENPDQLTIGTVNENEKVLELWLSVQGNRIEEMFKVPIEEPTVINKIYNAWKEGKKSVVIDISGDELKKYEDFRSGLPEYKTYNDVKNFINKEEARRVIHCAFFPKGLLSLATPEPRPEETKKLLERFAGVFDLTYTRFLDLKKVEAQAREAQIETALERVRARTMAMHNSNELGEVASVLFEQISSLTSTPDRFNIAIANEEDKSLDVWITDQEGHKITQRFIAKTSSSPVVAELFQSWKKQENHLILDLYGEKLEKWIRYMGGELGMPFKKNSVKDHRFVSSVIFSHGFIGVTTHKEPGSETINLLERFSKVFQQTYVRFLDLKKAEAQAREAKIEAALERVRAKAMAMHSSDDLAETVDTFFSELTHLNVMPHRCGVGIINSETRTVDINATTATHENEIKKITGKLKLSGHPVLDNIFENWKLQKEYHPVLRGKEIVDYYKVMNPQVEFPDFAGDEIQYGYYFFFKEGGVFAWTEKELSEEDLNIFRRFTSVLSLTYRRYLDLKDAEARAAEAVRQTSLDRVRAEIASMRTTEDLNRITPIIWRELKALEVPFIRCGVFIVDEANKSVGVFLTTPDGKALGVLHLAFDSNELTSNTVENWRKKQVYKEHWNKEEFINWTKSMMKLGQVQNAETYQGSSQPPESLHLHFVPFTQGMLYVGNVTPLDEEKLELVKTLAEAFSIAYARYEDFKNLEEAKGKIELTLSELKSAQAQLVHSEKMASLGELTAGIAHEIKNPLNFVNNFSEVSTELIDEMMEELEKGNNEDVLDIVKDLKQNLEKINHHGKRADSIVKGMLLHSRGTAGEKTPTDINDLLEQYLNLAYHGMRAQNKDFNITIERDYDKTLGKINVVPQDISRVFLNIINNGCYAANDKKKKEGDGFSPTIKVSTKNLKNKVEIRISDNGNGIPDKIKDKLFQPFFTTKPTGEGTGLGLSLSYDIVVKQHNGEIKIESKECEGAEFVITLPSA